MKLRIECAPEEIQEALNRIKQIFSVKSVSRPYQNRNNDNVRIYIELM